MEVLVSFLQSRGHSLDVDTVDRLRYFHIPRILAGVALFIFAKNYVGEPVQCWMPKQFKGGWEQYVEQYCLVEGTYYVNMDMDNMPSAENRKKIIYYQWVPFILILISATLYAPRVAWRAYQRHSGLDVSSIVTQLRTSAREMKEQNVVVKSDNKAREFLPSAILIHKVVSIVIMALQLLFLNIFFGSGWAVQALQYLFQGVEWQESGAFPRVTFCDATVREMGGHINDWTVQCVLMVNLFNEKIFFVLFWILVALCFISIANVIQWYLFLHNERDQRELVESLIDSSTASKAVVDEFTRGVVKRSGAALIRLSQYNVSYFDTQILVQPLWETFYESAKKEATKYIDESSM